MRIFHVNPCSKFFFKFITESSCCKPKIKYCIHQGLYFFFIKDTGCISYIISWSERFFFFHKIVIVFSSKSFHNIPCFLLIYPIFHSNYPSIITHSRFSMVPFQTAIIFPVVPFPFSCPYTAKIHHACTQQAVLPQQAYSLVPFQILQHHLSDI